MSRWLRVCLSVAATAGLGGLASKQVRTQWYVGLDKPAFQPPDATFPVAWTTLYTDIALTAGHVLGLLETGGRDGDAAAYRRALAVNLMLNASWSWIFFRWHRLDASVAVAGLLTISSADLVRRTGRVSKPAAFALAPYPVWCAFATALTTAISQRNPGR